MLAHPTGKSQLALLIESFVRGHLVAAHFYRH
jgi:hypothetical protein